MLSCSAAAQAPPRWLGWMLPGPGKLEAGSNDAMARPHFPTTCQWSVPLALDATGVTGTRGHDCISYGGEGRIDRAGPLLLVHCFWPAGLVCSRLGRDRWRRDSVVIARAHVGTGRAVLIRGQEGGPTLPLTDVRNTTTTLHTFPSLTHDIELLNDTEEVTTIPQLPTSPARTNTSKVHLRRASISRCTSTHTFYPYTASMSDKPLQGGPHPTMAGNMLDPGVEADGAMTSSHQGVGGTSEGNVRREGMEHIKSEGGVISPGTFSLTGAPP